MSISIDRVETRRDFDEFVTLPRRLYAGMPGYVAPLDFEQRRLLDPNRGPFFAHGEAAYWIARRGGRSIGRISAQVDRHAAASHSRDRGFFGCLDTIDDTEATAALTAAASDWLRSRGRCFMQGPYLLSINGASGLLTEGHLAPPMTLMPWHPPYIQELLIGAGFARVQTLLAFELTRSLADAETVRRTAASPRTRSPITVRGFNQWRPKADLEIARRLFNDAWSGNWGFVPFDAAEMNSLRSGFRPFLVADSMIVAECDGEPVGFLLVVPNVFEITADLGGALGPLDWLRLGHRVLFRRNFRRCRIILMGIASRLQGTLLGAETLMAMFIELKRRADARGISAVEAGWILETNGPMIGILRRFGFRQCRAYGIFEKTI